MWTQMLAANNKSSPVDLWKVSAVVKEISICQWHLLPRMRCSVLSHRKQKQPIDFMHGLSSRQRRLNNNLKTNTYFEKCFLTCFLVDFPPSIACVCAYADAAQPSSRIGQVFFPLVLVVCCVLGGKIYLWEWNNKNNSSDFILVVRSRNCFSSVIHLLDAMLRLKCRPTTCETCASAVAEGDTDSHWTAVQGRWGQVWHKKS